MNNFSTAAHLPLPRWAYVPGETTEAEADYATLAQANSISERLTAPDRGLITDRFGVIVAGNQQHWRASFMQALAPDPQAAASTAVVNAIIR